MSKERKPNKNNKKQPLLSPKEKKAAKQAKKQNASTSFIQPK